jgi:hypothetical protein
VYLNFFKFMICLRTFLRMYEKNIQLYPVKKHEVL